MGALIRPFVQKKIFGQREKYENMVWPSCESISGQTKPPPNENNMKS